MFTQKLVDFVKYLFYITVNSPYKPPPKSIETKMENRQTRWKKIFSGKIGKVRFVGELELYKIVQDRIFRKRIKTW